MQNEVTPDKRIRLLVINGISDSGMLRAVKSNTYGKISFSTGGSCNIAAFLPPEKIKLSHFILDQHTKQDISSKYVLSHDLVLCEISEPDSHSNSLKKAQQLFDLLHDKMVWINNPYRVVNTRRDAVPELLANMENVIAPKTLSVQSKTIDEIKIAIETNKLSLPVLLRPAGSHGGKGLKLIEKYSDLSALNLSIYNNAFVTEFVDSGENGLYKKYRFAVVKGEPMPRHVLTNDHWMIHSAARAYTADKSDLLQAEKDLFENFETELKPQIRDTIWEIYQRIGLDYFGIDCAFKGGKILIFEVNANMNILHNNQPTPNVWEKQITRIKDLIVEKLMVKRAT